MDTYYAIIIGFGKGGKTLAADLANRGKKVAMIEKSERMYGGTCINIACIPSKSLVNSAMLSQIHKPATFEEKAILYTKAIEEKRRLTALLRGKNFDKLNNNDNVDVFTGKASFLSAHRVSVKMPNDTVVLEGENIIINTGAVPALPPIAGLAGSKRVYTSETLMERDQLPKRLAIIGAGHIGLEFASIYSNFGSAVTVFQDGARFLPREDQDIAAEILKVLTEKGIAFKLGATVKAVKDHPQETVISYWDSVLGEGSHFAADAVLIATGRKPYLDGLDIALAGVETTAGGAVKVDDYLRTNVPGVWAMGDVNGGPQFTYISMDDYRIVVSQLGGGVPRSVKNRTNLPHSLFIDPAYSRVGLSEKEAKEQGYSIRIARLPASAIPKAHVVKQTQGLLKAVIDANTDKILGATLFCAGSCEMINTVKLAMDAGLPYTFLRDQIFTHPTMSESLNDLFSV